MLAQHGGQFHAGGILSMYPVSVTFLLKAFFETWGGDSQLTASALKYGQLATNGRRVMTQ
jgi:hypothetical protein